MNEKSPSYVKKRRKRPVRRWVRVACISYDSDYVTYLGRLGKDQPHPVVEDRRKALLRAEREIRTIQKIGIEARIWRPLLVHRDSGHIHIVALVTPAQLRRLFPSEHEVRGSVERRQAWT